MGLCCFEFRDLEPGMGIGKVRWVLSKWIARRDGGAKGGFGI